MVATDYTCIPAEEVQVTGIKPYLFKPVETLWRVIRNSGGKLEFVSEIAVEKITLLGVLSCDIKALALLDKVFLEGDYSDPRYQARREHLQIIPAENEVPLPNSFAREEIPDLRQVPQEKLMAAKVWDDVASRCLGCGACTQACPTCFCHKQTAQENGEQVREWDSCFSDGHSFIHGAPLRKTKKERYQKWVMHKFVEWHEQFGEVGCVGCGRCTTWCPVGINILDVVKQLHEESTQ